MSTITNILEMITGKARLCITVGGKAAIEINLNDKKKEIIAEVKNPVLAVQMGLHEIAMGGEGKSYLLEKIHAAGYKVKVKYKMFELEL